MPILMEVREYPTLHAQSKEKQYIGKHACLWRELSLAVCSWVEETVCNVVVLDDDRGPNYHGFNIIAAQTDGESEYVGFSTANINQALECEDKAFWNAAMLYEIVNSEEIFGAFGLAIPHPPGKKATTN